MNPPSAITCQNRCNRSGRTKIEYSATASPNQSGVAITGRTRATSTGRSISTGRSLTSCPASAATCGSAGVVHPRDAGRSRTDGGHDRPSTGLSAGHRRTHAGCAARAGTIRHGRVEADHSRLKARLRQMRGLSRIQSARIVARSIDRRS
jgi:hypothetical protein